MNFVSYIDRLREELETIASEFEALLERSIIRNVNPNSYDSSVVFIGAADWGWGPSDGEVTAVQMKLLARYAAWSQRFQLLFPHPTPKITEQVETVDEFVRRWVSRPDTWDHTIPATIELAKARAAKEMAVFGNLLDVAAKAGTDELRLVPDTSALLRNPDLASYGRGMPLPLRIHLVPTVVQELDDLKDRGKHQDVRGQAQAVVRRLKGLRDKGSLAAGVNVTREIALQTEAREVDPRDVLDWLDPLVPDDRILGAALRLQSDHPAGSVVLVTSDLNLQNKADAVGLPYVETPPTTDSLRAKPMASIEWRDSGPPQLMLTNAGRAVARNLRFSLSTPDDAPPPHWTSGPWTVDRLEPGETSAQEVYGGLGDVAILSAEWTDNDGAQTLKVPVPVSDRPPPRVPLARAFRTGR